MEQPAPAGDSAPPRAEGFTPVPAVPRDAPAPEAREPQDADPRPGVAYVGERPPTYEGEPTALPLATAESLADLVPDTVLDGARYGTMTLRSASVRGDSPRYRGELRRDALLTARFGAGSAALILVAIATGGRSTGDAHLAARDACQWTGAAVARSHARLAEDIREGRRGSLKAGLHRLTGRSFGLMRAKAEERGVAYDAYTATLHCLLLPADPASRTRVYFGTGPGGLFRLRDGVWQDIEPAVPEPEPQDAAPPSDHPPTLAGVEEPPLPFAFRASPARPGDVLLLCSPGLTEPLRAEPSLSARLAERWHDTPPPGLASFLADVQLRAKGHADDRTAAAVWES